MQIETGKISLSNSKEIRFGVSKYQGRKYGIIRVFFTAGAYIGPSRKGVNIPEELLHQVANVMMQADAGGIIHSEQILSEWPFTRNSKLRLYKARFHGRELMHLREYVDGGQEFNGYTKKGVAVQKELWGTFCEQIALLSRKLEADDSLTDVAIAGDKTHLEEFLRYPETYAASREKREIVSRLELMSFKFEEEVQARFEEALERWEEAVADLEAA